MNTEEMWPRGRWSLVNVVVLAACLLTMGCSSERKPVNEKQVVKVTGKVLVDGNPFGGIRLNFHTATPEASHRVFPRAVTDEQGNYVAWTYRKDDGLAPGEYTVTFLDHSTATPTTRESEKVDLFQGKYADKKASQHKLTVPSTGEAFEAPTFELTR